jgi:hypothetical protein
MAPGIQDIPADQPMYIKPKASLPVWQLRVGLAIWLCKKMHLSPRSTRDEDVSH